MTSKRLSSFLFAALFMAGGFGSLRAEDWTTITGKEYHDVKVLSAEPDAVTILHHDGGALVPLELLTPALQKRFNYDPDKARAAADKRAQEEFADARALRAEWERVAEQRETEEEEVACVPAASTGTVVATSATTGGTHYSMDSIATSASSMRRDLGDSDYHTMANLAASIHSLQADPNDLSHRTISQVSSY